MDSAAGGQREALPERRIGTQTELVHSLARRARPATWGYLLLSSYYACIMALVLIVSAGGLDIARVAASAAERGTILLPLAGYVLATASLALCAAKILALGSVGRRIAATAAIVIAGIAALAFLWDLAQSVFAGVYSLPAQAFAALLVALHAFCALRLAGTVRRLQKYVLIEGEWFPALPPERIAAPL